MLSLIHISRANFSRRRRNLNAAGLKPDVVVPLEGFSIRITQQARAIGNLRGRLRLRPCLLYTSRCV